MLENPSPMKSPSTLQRVFSKSDKVPRLFLLFFRLFNSVHLSEHTGKVGSCPNEIKSRNLTTPIEVVETFIKCRDCPFFFSLDSAECDRKIKRWYYTDLAIVVVLVALGNVSEGGDCFRDPSWDGVLVQLVRNKTW